MLSTDLRQRGRKGFVQIKKQTSQVLDPRDRELIFRSGGEIRKPVGWIVKAHFPSHCISVSGWPGADFEPDEVKSTGAKGVEGGWIAFEKSLLLSATWKDN